MATTTNATTAIADKLIVQNVNLLRFAANEANRILDMLDDLEAELIGDLEDVVGKTDFTIARLRALLAATRKTVLSAYDKITATNEKRLVEIAEITAEKAMSAVNTSIGADLVGVAWSAAQLKSIATNTVIRGSFFSDWWDSQAERLQERFEREMQMGLLRGETVADLATRVRGTKALGYTDGIMTASKRQAEALVRTSALGVTNSARMESYAANDEIIRGVQWVSTLDDRTTFECMALDGCVWEFPDGDGDADYVDYIPIGHDKEFEPPPIHWNCRSTVVPLTYSWKELAGEHGNSRAAALADEVPEKSRASMDGQVAADMTFSDWLETKSESFQDDVLGASRAEMWRSGELDLRGLTDQSNNPLTLEQLREG